MTENKEKSYDVCGIYPMRIMNSLDTVQSRLWTLEYWKCPFISKVDLAYNGFYYVGYEDRVKCHYCKIIICDFEANDEIAKIHMQQAPRCFVNRLYSYEIEKEEKKRIECLKRKSSD